METLGRAPSPLAINRYVTRCQLRTAVSVTVINPACLPRSCVIVPANRNSARVHIEQDNTSRNGAARRGASLCKYAEVEGIDRLLNSPLPEAWKFLQFFSGKKISWEEIFWEGNRDTRTSMHSFSRIFNIRRPLSTLLVAQSLCIGVIILKVRTDRGKREIESHNLSFSSNLLPLKHYTRVNWSGRSISSQR